MKKQKRILVMSCLLAVASLISIGCLEDYAEPKPPVDTEGMEACDAPETWRCNGDTQELCRDILGNVLWRPMADCGNVEGGTCIEPGDGTQPSCGGDYWVTSYCPQDGPASSSCGAVTAAGCCDNTDVHARFVYCGDDGMLYCEQCWSNYGYSCGWDTTLTDPNDPNSASAGYGCYEVDGKVVVDSDPTGTVSPTCAQ